MANTTPDTRIHLLMSRNDILEKVRRAIHMADNLHTGDTALAERLLHAAERCRDANREFVDLLKTMRPTTAASESARAHLLQQLTAMDCGDDLLRSMLEPGNAPQADIHTAPSPGQVQ